MERHDSQRLIVVLLATITAILVGAALVAAKSVVLPLVFAIFATYTIEPLVRLLRRLHIPRVFAAFLVVGLLFAAVEVTIDVIAGAVDQLDARLPEYAATLQHLIDRLPLPAGVDVRLEDPELWRGLALSLAGDVGSLAGALTAFLANVSLVMVLTIALVIGRASFDKRLDFVAFKATGRADRSAAVIDSIDAGIQRYMLVKALVSAAMGLTLYLVQLAFGADFAVLWGFVAFVLNFVPTFGPVIAAVPAVALLFVQYPDNPGLALAGALVTAAVPIVFVNAIEPKLFGDHLNLNFVAVVMALLFWVFLWGAAGAVVALPVTLSISLICREVPALRTVHDLLRA